jgi:hypothetical protein
MVRYSIKVHTANERNAGTDADVYVILFGDAGETQPMRKYFGGNKTHSSVEGGHI